MQNIDHEVLANIATRTKIMKDKLLSQHGQVQEFLSREMGDNSLTIFSNEGLVTKVHSRLLSSKLLADVIWLLCDNLRKLLGHEPKKPRKEINAMRNPEISRTVNNSSSHKMTFTTGIHTDMEVGVQAEDEQKKFIDEIGWESGTVVGNEQHGVPSLDSGNDSEDLEYSEFKDDVTNSDRLQSDVSMEHKVISQPGISTFLPSLSVGFVGGSDESDWSDTEAKFADSVHKKNRRGQRARRA